MLARPLFGSVVCFPFYLITVAQYYHWACIHATSGLLDPFHCSQAFLAHFFLLEHPRPISFPSPSLAHSNSTFPWVFAKSCGLPRPNYHILYFWGWWASHQSLTHLIHCLGPLWPILACFLSHIMPMGLLFLSLGSSRPVASSKAHLLFSRPMIHYSCYLGLMIFSPNLLTLFSYIVGLLPAIGLFCQNEHQQIYTSSLL